MDITLQGDLTVERAGELHQLLTERLSSIEGPEPAGINLSGVLDLDACCCQLLGIFRENLMRRGSGLVLKGVSPELDRKLVLLGYNEILGR